ncbi:MAG: PA14 domain-containing protein [Eubacteriales bacterium]
MKFRSILSLGLAGILLFLPACKNSTPDTTTADTAATTTSPGEVIVKPLTERTPTVGVYAEYFKGRSCDTFVGSEIVSEIDFEFVRGIAPYSGVGRTDYSIRYSGQILASKTGEYTFTTTADDGALLTVGDTVVISDAGPHLAESHSGTISLKEGEYYPFTLEYYNGELGGSIHLLWTPPRGAESTVPAENLFLPAHYANIHLNESNSKIEATASPIAYDGGGTLIMEKVVDGTVAERAETPLDGNTPVTCTMGNASAGDVFRTYVINGGNEMISELTTKRFGVDFELTLDPATTTGTVSDYLIGACMEDVNHELYGGIWSQMIFGEKFAEPSTDSTVTGEFDISDGTFNAVVKDGASALKVERGDNGPKLTFRNTESASGSATMEMMLDGEGPVGFIIKASNLRPGADNFYGYEVALGNNFLRLAKHENNYTPLKEVSVNAPKGSWVTVTVEYTADTFTVSVNGEEALTYTDPSPITSGSIGLRAWNASAYFRNITVKTDGGVERKIEYGSSASALSVSKCWDAAVSGSIDASAFIDTETLFNGQQTQKLIHKGGDGALFLSNRGLNRMGMSFVEGKEYEGYLYIAADRDTSLTLFLCSVDGDQTYASTTVAVQAGDFVKYPFTMTSNATDANGKFVISLTSPAEINIGYAFLQPGEWARYKGLPVRKDVAEGMESIGLSVLRFGGCMANAADYKWKDMIGAPEDRPTYAGWWYAYSSLGFGIIEFMDLCEAMGILYVPDFNAYESPEDMADFVRFALGTDPTDKWVQLRISMGRTEPYHLKMIQIGNEEKVNADYARRFNAIANAVKDIAPDLILVVGDFAYKNVITDPYNFTGSDGGITSLAPHKSILDNAVKNGQTVWFDIHWWSESGNEPDSFIQAAFSLYDALKSICPESDPKLCVFELNANSHTLERALCNAYAINATIKASDIFPVICSANCLQVQDQNDNGWNQGLVFMDSDEVWLQPPALAAKLIGSGLQGTLIAHTADENADFSVSATRSADGKTVTVTVINRYETAKNIWIDCAGMGSMTVQSLSGALRTVNTATDPNRITISDPTACNGQLVPLPVNSVNVITVEIN